MLWFPAAALVPQIPPNERKVSASALRASTSVLLIGWHFLNHPDHILLGPAVALSVSLRRGEATVTSELLNIPQATTGLVLAALVMNVRCLLWDAASAKTRSTSTSLMLRRRQRSAA